MLNMDQNKLVEAINHFIINKYAQNISSIKVKMIKLYSSMPYCGAPNVSDAQSIAIIEDLEKFVANNYTVSCN